MSKPLVLILAGALFGTLIGVVHVGGDSSLKGAGLVLDALSGFARTFKAEVIGPTTPAGVSVAQGMMFTACLTRSGPQFEHSLKNLLEFHEHEATLDLVECLLAADPLTFCDAEGAQQVADAMEIYLWSRDDSHRTSPAHDLADKIHMLDRGPPERSADEDQFIVTWAGPRDRALFEKIKDLVKQGYLDPGPLAYSGRAELREAVHGLQTTTPRCVRTAAP